MAKRGYDQMTEAELLEANQQLMGRRDGEG